MYYVIKNGLTFYEIDGHKVSGRARDYISSTVYVLLVVYTCTMYTQVCTTANHRTELGVDVG